MTRRLAADEINGDGRGVCHGRVEVINDALVIFKKIGKPRHELNVVDVKMLGNAACVFDFGILLDAESDGKRLNAGAKLACHRRNDRRIDSARQKASERHIAEHVIFDALHDRVAQPFFLFVERNKAVGLEARVEVFDGRNGHFLVDDGIMSRGQDLDVGRDGVGLGHILEGEKALERRVVDLVFLHVGVEHKRLEFR